MPWMRIAIGAGATAMVAGVAGMSLWINDGSHYFDVAVALALAGLLTLASCVLTRVFGSSHGSQDDAFRRGRSMGYDAGFLEGHRTARPVVVPLHIVATRDVDADDQESPSDDLDEADDLDASSADEQSWGRHARHDAGDQLVAWSGARRIPLLAGALCLALVGAVFTSAAFRKPAPAETLQLAQGPHFYGAVPPADATTAGEGTPLPSSTSVPVLTGVPPAGPAVAARTAAAPAEAPVGVAGVTQVTVYLPAASGPVTSTPVPVGSAPATAPAGPLTAAQQTAADAAAAAAGTAANARAAADLTAADAAAAAEATRLQALADAYAVAHPQP